MIKCWVNGTPSQMVSAFDRGLSYGDGLFTTALIQSGKVQYLMQHIERLQTGCEKLAITFSDFDTLSQQLVEIAGSYERSVLKVVITAGAGGRGYSRVGAEQPTVIIAVFPYPEHYFGWQNQGVRLEQAKTQLGLQPMLAGIKHLNRLEQVLVRKELDNTNADDLVVCDINNMIVETSCANVFWVSEGKIKTPKLYAAGVAGIIRHKLLQLLPNVEQVSEEAGALSDAEEIWLCNSIMGVVPVSHFMGRPLKMEQGKALQRLIEQ